MFTKCCSSLVVVVDPIILRVLSALGKTDSPILWGSRQDLGLTDRVTHWMSNMFHPRCLFPYPQGQAALTGLSQESAVASSLCFHSHLKNGVCQHTDHQVETILTLEESCMTLCSTSLFLPRELLKWVKKVVDGQQALHGVRILKSILPPCSGCSAPRLKGCLTCLVSRCQWLLSGWGSPESALDRSRAVSLMLFRVALVLFFFFKAGYYLC